MSIGQIGIKIKWFNTRKHWSFWNATFHRTFLSFSELLSSFCYRPRKASISTLKHFLLSEQDWLFLLSLQHLYSMLILAPLDLVFFHTWQIYLLLYLPLLHRTSFTTKILFLKRNEPSHERLSSLQNWSRSPAGSTDVPQFAKQLVLSSRKRVIILEVVHWSCTLLNFWCSLVSHRIPYLPILL